MEEDYENLIGVLTSEICRSIFRIGDEMMSILEGFGVGVEYSDGKGELCPGNSYSITRVEGELEEYEDEPDEETTHDQVYRVNLESGMAESMSRGDSYAWPIQLWLINLIRQHNLFHARAYYAANAMVDDLGEGDTAVKYIDGDSWGYEIFKDGHPVRRRPEGREQL